MEYLKSIWTLITGVFTSNPQSSLDSYVAAHTPTDCVDVERLVKDWQRKQLLGWGL